MYVPIEVEDYKRRFVDGSEEHLLLDVRTPEEFTEIRIPGAQLIPLDDLSDRVDELPLDLPLVVVCRTGVRSIMAIQMLRYAGLKGDLFNLEGGTREWALAGHPTEQG
jgi:rhodanese-related sulfurtransferase